MEAAREELSGAVVVVAVVRGAVAAAAAGRPFPHTFLCAHGAPSGEHRARPHLYEWPDDGSVTTYAVRRGPADAA